MSSGEPETMLEILAIEILLVSTGFSPPSNQIEYLVTNRGAASAWLVDDHWLVWSLSGKRIELSYKRGEMRKGSQVFGYFDPTVVEIKPGQEFVRKVELVWPQRLDRLWNEASLAAPPPGVYEVVVICGYGLTPRPDPPAGKEGVEAPVLRWQREAVSQPLRMEIPPYQEPSDGARQP